MRLDRLLIGFSVLFVCVQSGVARPSEVKEERRRAGRKGARGGRGGRRMRLLNKAFKRITAAELAALSRPPPHMLEQQNSLQNDAKPAPPHMSRFNKVVANPQLSCGSAEDGIKMFACPSPDRFGRFRCIDDHELCDNRFHCPNGEDEDRTVCMFHKMTMNYFKVLMKAVFGLTRKRQ